MLLRLLSKNWNPNEMRFVGTSNPLLKGINREIVLPAIGLAITIVFYPFILVFFLTFGIGGGWVTTFVIRFLLEASNIKFKWAPTIGLGFGYVLSCYLTAYFFGRYRSWRWKTEHILKSNSVLTIEWLLVRTFFLLIAVIGIAFVVIFGTVFFNLI
jgi:hypothetical protein